jgi:hypothetical protein
MPFFTKVGFSVKNVLKTALFWPNWPKNIETLRLNSKMYFCFSDKATPPPEVKNKKPAFKGKNFAGPFSFLILDFLRVFVSQVCLHF